MLVTLPLNNVKACKFYILKNKVVQVVPVVVNYNPVVVYSTTPTCCHCAASDSLQACS